VSYARTLYNPAARFALNLRAGQSTSQTVRVFVTDTDTESGEVTRREYDQTYTLTFVGVESVTVPAGTYTAAKVIWGFRFNSPAQNDTPASQVEATATNWFDAGLGTVKSTLDSNTKAEFAGEDGEGKSDLRNTHAVGH
jgi:hypothetical protein